MDILSLNADAMLSKHRTLRQIDGRPHVIIIDDDPLFRGVLAGILRPGYRLTVAKDGADGFYQALDDVPDLAIIDVQMPGWGGLQTLQAFRADPSLNSVRIIMLTGDVSRETLVTAIKAGADDYVIKAAFSGEGLVERLTALQMRWSKCKSLVEIGAPPRVAAAFAPIPDSGFQDRVKPGGVDDALLQEAIDSWD
jgi:DNA-binding response OmpR family regulator